MSKIRFPNRTRHRLLCDYVDLPGDIFKMGMSDSRWRDEGLID